MSALTCSALTCARVEERKFVWTDGKWVYDKTGRVLMLYGTNVSEWSKYGEACRKQEKEYKGYKGPCYLPRQTQEHFKKLKKWGFNFVRFLIFWAAIEPEPGRIDFGYLEKVLERVRWLEELGIYVLIDMHQDRFAEMFLGDGAPRWAAEFASGVTEYKNTHEPYLDPVVIKAFDAFWQNKIYPETGLGLQDHFALAWKVVAEVFRNEKHVVGYDILNEPFPGLKDIKTFEAEILTPFYRKIINAIREIDKEHLIFFEPNIFKPTGVRSYISIEDLGDDKLVWAPHYYKPEVLIMGMPYDGNKSQMDEILALYSEEAKSIKVAWIIGEWGAIHPGHEGFSKYITDLLALFDKYLVGWAWWEWGGYDIGGGFSLELWDIGKDPKEKREILELLIRPRPLKISGFPKRISYSKGIFEFEWEEIPNPYPTEIFVPGKPEIEIDGEYSFEEQILKIPTIGKVKRLVRIKFK